MASQESSLTISLNSLKIRAVARLLSWLLRGLYSSLRVTTIGDAQIQALCREYGSVILVAWHGHSLVPIAGAAGKGYWGMVSLSRDGNLLSECFRCLGWRTIRGSSGRNGVKAMKAALEILAEPGTVLAITPDGPRGPAHKVQLGALYIARKSGCPIIPVGIGVDRYRQAKSWDRFVIPLPFARVRWLYGEPFFVAETADMEQMGLALEEALIALEGKAQEPFLSSSAERDTSRRIETS